MEYISILKNLLIVLLIALKNNSYVANLNIPKIDLAENLYAINSPYNNIAYNIAYHEESTINNTIILGHSGTSHISFFENLRYLNIGDVIYYNNDEYIIDNTYRVLKTGLLDIIYDENRITLTLITCLDNDYQLVIVAYKKINA